MSSARTQYLTPLTDLSSLGPSKTELSPRSKKYGQLASRFSSFALLGKKRKFSESSIDTALLLDLEDEEEDAPPSTNIQRPLADDRDRAMRELRDLFTYESSRSHIPDKRWMRIRACMEFFPHSSYCTLVFLSIVSKTTESSHFKKKLKDFVNNLEHWCSWNLVDSLKRSLDTFDVITNIMEHAIVPKFTSKGSSWKYIISQAMVHDLQEFNSAFLNPAVIEDLHQADDYTVQNIVDIVQIALKHVAPSGSRELDRFLMLTVERRGILPSTIFLSGVHRLGTNFVHGGGFADVWKGEMDGKPVALKVLRIFSSVDRDKMQIDFSKEALLWRKLDHSNVLPFLGICRDEFAPQMALVSYWMDKGSLVDFLAKNPSADCIKLATGVACGLDYLHSLKPQIIHGDLRAANVLVDENDEPRITDFGLARAIDSQGSTVSTSFKGKGTLRWQAPELLHASRFGEESSKLTSKSDVYAFSCLCLEIFSGKVPFAGLRDGAVIMEVAVHDRRPPWPGEAAVLRGLDGDIWFIMQLCWKTRPADRPDMPIIVTRLQSIDFRRKFL